MAFLRYANARITHPVVRQDQWAVFRRDPQIRTASTINLANQAAEILGERFDPTKYLLSHASIVASVDTEKVPGVQIGTVVENGRQINRKFDDYYITPDSASFVNGNGDSFQREVLLKSYRTFVGSHNFLEHCQVAELSKGRIIDAVARDIGPSVYTDILVATHRRHTDLIPRIESGQLSTLSMGCSTVFCTCTKCGNVAADETQLCPCIRFEKGNHFYDPQGKRRIIAELCGHPTAGETGGVNFIEASWVEIPAFKGAVLRNILEPARLSPKAIRKMEQVLSSPAKQWSSEELKKAAFLSSSAKRKLASLFESNEDWRALQVVVAEVLAESRSKQKKQAADDWDFGGDSPAEEAEESMAPQEPDKEPGPLDTLEKEVEEEVFDRVKKRIKDQIDPPKIEPSKKELAVSTNDGVIKDGTLLKAASGYRSGLKTLMIVSKTPREFLDNVRRFHEACGIRVPQGLYRVAIHVGSSKKYRNLSAFLQACVRAMGRRPTHREARTLVRLSHLLTQQRLARPKE